MGALACALMVAGCTGDIGKLDGLEEETSDPSAIPNGSVDPGGSQAGPLETASCTAGTVAPSPARYWRLSDAQYSNAIKDLLPMVTPVEVKTPGTSDQQFQNNAELFRVSGPIAAQYQTTAEKAAADAVTHLRRSFRAIRPAKKCAQNSSSANSRGERFGGRS